MKSRLINTGVSVKSECTRMDIATVHSKVEDSGMFELFEPDVDKVKCPLECPETCDRNNKRIRIMKESTPMKDTSSMIKDKPLLLII